MEEYDIDSMAFEDEQYESDTYIVALFSSPGILSSAMDYTKCCGSDNVRFVFSMDKIYIMSHSIKPAYIHMEIDISKLADYEYIHTEKFFSMNIDAKSMMNRFKAAAKQIGSAILMIKSVPDTDTYKFTIGNTTNNISLRTLVFSLDETSEINTINPVSKYYHDNEPVARTTNKMFEFIVSLELAEYVIVSFCLMDNSDIHLVGHALTDKGKKLPLNNCIIESTENRRRSFHTGISETSEVTIYEREICIGVNPNNKSRAKRKSPSGALKKIPKFAGDVISIYFDVNTQPIIQSSMGDFGLFTCVFNDMFSS